MMLLLDFPPKIFEEIVHEAVGQCGISGAWKLRGVCRTFSAAITHDIFAKQPIQSFAILKKNPLEKDLGLYLFYRSKSPLDANSYLPDKINEMIEYLADELGKTAKHQKEELRQCLCGSLGKISSFSKIMDVLENGLDLDPSIEPVDKLIATMCLYSPDPIAKLLEQMPSHRAHPVFGNPLAAATLLQQDSVVVIILTYFATALERKDQHVENSLRWVSPRFIKENGPGFRPQIAILTAIIEGNTRCVDLLVKWYNKYMGVFPKVAYNEFLDQAIRTPGLKTLRHVVKIPFKEPKRRSLPRVTQLHYERACSQGRADIVRLFLKQKYINANDETLSTTRLVKAVLSNKVDIVKVLLDAGANPNTTSLFRVREEKKSSMSFEFLRNNPKIIQCLLDAWATLPEITKWPRHQKAYEVLQRAHMQRSTRWVPAFDDFMNMTAEYLERVAAYQAWVD